ncbi:hypothetical protein KCP77_01215 [Salmonella enterica subsp. enterica]|nr:hypothetical protein KCP77_01215 [Salmonella enterica subsp. enterica]
MPNRRLPARQLHDKQREAVAAPRSNMLVKVGGRVWKTRVLRTVSLVIESVRKQLAILHHGGDLLPQQKRRRETRHRIGLAKLMGTVSGGNVGRDVPRSGGTLARASYGR